jgi:hypothetical protein
VAITAVTNTASTTQASAVQIQLRKELQQARMGRNMTLAPCVRKKWKSYANENGGDPKRAAKEFQAKIWKILKKAR